MQSSWASPWCTLGTANKKLAVANTAALYILKNKYLQLFFTIIWCKNWNLYDRIITFRHISHCLRYLVLVRMSRKIYACVQALCLQSTPGVKKRSPEGMVAMEITASSLSRPSKEVQLRSLHEQQGSHVRLYAELFLPELPNFMQYCTWHDVHMHVVRTSSTHRLHIICTSSACHLHMCICCLHQGMSSVHCLQAICTTPHGHRGPELSFTVTGICY